MFVFDDDDDDACDDDDDVEEAQRCVFMVRLKNDFDAKLDELLKNEDSAFANTPPFVVEDERRDDEDLAAKTPAARFAALLNMIDEISSQSTIKFCGDTTRAS